MILWGMILGVGPKLSVEDPLGEEPLGGTKNKKEKTKQDKKK
jgi:hypothetical protein